jgi:hypothetical protein
LDTDTSGSFSGSFESLVFVTGGGAVSSLLLFTGPNSNQYLAAGFGQSVSVGDLTSGTGILSNVLIQASSPVYELAYDSGAGVLFALSSSAGATIGRINIANPSNPSVTESLSLTNSHRVLFLFSELNLMYTLSKTGIWSRVHIASKSHFSIRLRMTILNNSH